MSSLRSRLDRLFTLLGIQGKTLATAESCTGGLIGAAITDVPGASEFYERGFITYSNAAKQDLLGVPEPLLAAHGAVSEPVARAMADGVLNAAPNADCALSVTGIAGPGGGSPEKPVGLVFIGCALRGEETIVQRHVFPGDRAAIREQSAAAALDLLIRRLETI